MRFWWQLNSRWIQDAAAAGRGDPYNYGAILTDSGSVDERGRTWAVWAEQEVREGLAHVACWVG